MDPVPLAPAPPRDSRICDRVPPHPFLATRIARCLSSPPPPPPPPAPRTQLRPTKAAASGSAAPSAAFFPFTQAAVAVPRGSVVGRP